MQSTYTHTQVPEQQYPLGFNSQLSRRGSPPGVPNSLTSYIDQDLAPYHNAHPYTQQGTYRDPTSAHSEPGYGYNVYGDPVPGHEFNHASSESWGALAPQPPNHGGYAVVPNVQYGANRQAGTDYAVYQPADNRFSRNTTNFSPLPSSAYIATSNQGVAPIWCLRGCWVSYMVEDEIHFTIVLKRGPFV